MPNPVKDETKEEFVARFMESAEARRDFPDQAQRAAVAYSKWEKKNMNIISNFVGVLKDPETMESIATKHGVSIESLKAEMEIGLKVEKEHTTDEATAGVIVLHHLAENPVYYSKEEFKNQGESAWPKAYKARHLEPGLVFYPDIGDIDPETKKTKGMMLLLKKEAIDKMRPSFRGKPVVNWFHKGVKPDDFKKGNADGIITGAYYNPEDGWDYVEFLVWDSATKENCDKGYRLSCAYVPTDVKVEKGLYHNIPYDGEVISGDYTHMAIVDNPRYERSFIMCNSMGGLTMKGLWLKLLNAVTGKPEPKELSNKAEIEIDGKKISLEELANSFKAEKAEKEKLALENSVKEMKDDSIITIDGEEVSVKDLKAAHAAFTARHNAAEEAGEKARKDKEEAERKNAEEAETKKKAEEEEKRNAEEKAKKDEADKKAEAEKKNAIEKDFLDLKNAKDKGGEVKKLPDYESTEDKIGRGKSKYGVITAEK